MTQQHGSPTASPPRQRLLVWLVAGLLLAGCGLVFIWRTFGSARAVEAARQSLRDFDPAAARAHLDPYLNRRPGDAAALLLATTAARRAEDHAEAERRLADLETRAGPTTESRFEWALLGAQQGDFTVGEDQLRADVDRHHPESPAILEALARGYFVSFRRRDAITALARLLDSEPGRVSALLLRGRVWESLRMNDAAEKDLRRAVELAPDCPPAHAALAGLLTRLGHTREALAHYQQAVRGRPADPATLLGLARAQTDAAELDEAEATLDKLLERAPEDADGLVERGRLALRRQRAAEAEPLLARAARSAPWRADALELHRLALADLGRTEEAARDTARLAELRAEEGIGGRLKLRAHDVPNDVPVRLELWQWSLRNGQLDEGAARLYEILRVTPGNTRAHAGLAEYFNRIGQPRRAFLHKALAGR